MEKTTDERLEHIESLLQRMPELIAASIIIEQERKDSLWGKKYSESVEICPVNQR